MKYSLAEIDEMRQAIFLIWHPSGSASYMTREEANGEVARREDELRTYMANGTTPEELRVKAAQKQWEASHR